MLLNLWDRQVYILAKNKMSLSFTATSENEAFARVSVSAFVSQLDPTLSDLSDIKVAVSEAVTNAIIHGYENMSGDVYLECSYDDDIVYILVKDCGKGIANIEEAMQPLYTSKPDMERSGMGFTVMESFMDTVSVESVPNEGTKIIMSKKLQKI